MSTAFSLYVQMVIPIITVIVGIVAIIVISSSPKNKNK